MEGLLRLPTEKPSLTPQARSLPLLSASGLWVCLITLTRYCLAQFLTSLSCSG